MAFEALVLTLGISHANPQDSGIWYLGDQPHVLHQNTVTYGLGWSNDKYRLGIQSLGKTETDAIVIEGTVPVYFRTIGKQYGTYALALFGDKIKWGIGTWVYRQSVFSDTYHQHFNSGAWGIGPMGELSSGPFSLTIRGAESRAKDWNGNHQPSPIKGFVSTFEVRF